MGSGGSISPFREEPRGPDAPTPRPSSAATRRAGWRAEAVSRPRARGFPASLRAQKPDFPSRPKPCSRRLRPAWGASSPHELHPSAAASLWTRNSGTKDSQTSRMNGRKSARTTADARRKRGSRAAFRRPGERQRPLATGGVLCA